MERTLDYALIDLFTKMTRIDPKMPLLGFSEPSLGLLRSVSWASQKEPKTMENVLFWARQSLGGAGAPPRLCREPSGGPSGPPNHGKSSQIRSKN